VEHSRSVGGDTWKKSRGLTGPKSLTSFNCFGPVYLSEGVQKALEPNRSRGTNWPRVLAETKRKSGNEETETGGWEGGGGGRKGGERAGLRKKSKKVVCEEIKIPIEGGMKRTYKRVNPGEIVLEALSCGIIRLIPDLWGTLGGKKRKWQIADYCGVRLC